MSPRSRGAPLPRRCARRQQRVQLRLRSGRARRESRAAGLHGRRLRPGTRDSRSETAREGAGHARGRGRLAPLGRAPGGHEHAADRVGVDPNRHEHEAIAEVCPKSLAQDVDDRLVTGVEDERDRLELKRLDLALVELCELGDEWEQTAKGLDVARQDGELGSEILDPRGQRLDQRRERLQLAR